MVVVAVKLLELLIAMQGHVRGIHIQNQFLGSRGKVGDEVFDQHLVQRTGVGASGTRLKAAERGRTGKRLVAPNRRLHQQVSTLLVMTVQVFVPPAKAV